MKVSHAAHFLNSSQRQNIRIQAIRGDTPIAHVAKHHGVSRKFVYQQKEKALEGISKAFEKQPLFQRRMEFQGHVLGINVSLRRACVNIEAEV